MKRISHSAVLYLGESIEAINRTPLSDLNQLFQSNEFKQYQEAKDNRFKALLKTIAGVNRI